MGFVNDGSFVGDVVSGNDGMNFMMFVSIFMDDGLDDVGNVMMNVCFFIIKD